MSWLRRRLRMFGWIAIGAMLAFALAPAVSQVLSADDASAPWSVVCSASGAASGSSKLPVAPADSANLFQHCPMCCPHSGNVALPPPSHGSLDAPDGVHFIAQATRPSTAPLFAWTATPARGPPTIA